MKDLELFTLPGLGGSEPEHWQSFWEDIYSMKRVEQASWDRPLLDDWLDSLHSYISNASSVVLVPHSLACSLVMHYIKKYNPENIKGVFFVAPADVDDLENMPEEIHNFAPMPLDKLRCKSIVITSEDDPYIDKERAKLFAKSWGSDFYNIGEFGHINKDSNIDEWVAGQALFNRFLDEITQ